MNVLIYNNCAFARDLIKNMLRKTLTIDTIEKKLEYLASHISYLIKKECFNQAKSCEKVHEGMNSNVLSNLVSDLLSLLENVCYYYCEVVRPLLNVFFEVLRENDYNNKSYGKLLNSCKKGNGIMVILWLIKSPCKPLAYEICETLKKHKII